MSTRRTDATKLSWILGMLDGTVNSVCDYSAEALIDRMQLMSAYIRDDEIGMERFGQLCDGEREAMTGNGLK